MKRFLALVAFLLAPLYAFAQSPGQDAANEAANFVGTLNEVVIFPLIGLLAAVAFFIFCWGAVQYLVNADNDQGRQQGVSHMTWGIIGLVVMLSAWTLLSIMSATFGLSDELNCAQDPTDPGCATIFSP